jgi:dephospho-CoA kinase
MALHGFIYFLTSSLLMAKIIIGLTGMNAAGKTTVIEYLKEKGFETMSLSDMIREELKSRDISETRDSLIDMGNELRKKHGPTALADLAAGKISGQAFDRWAIDSIRNPGEVQALRKLPGFFLMGITAPVEMRFERTKGRGRKEGAETLEQFKAQEQKEMSADEHSQQLHTCLKMANLILANTESIQALHQKIDLILGNFARLS